MSLAILGLIKGLAAPGLVFRLVVSAVGLTTVIALVPGGPALGVLNSIGSVTTAQAWMQDPARADDITEGAIFGAAAAAWLGVALDSQTRQTRAAPSLVLFVSLAIAAAGAVPWGSVAWLLAILLVSAAIYRKREGTWTRSRDSLVKSYSHCCSPLSWWVSGCSAVRADARVAETPARSNRPLPSTVSKSEPP